jgi:hypothetical protein
MIVSRLCSRIFARLAFFWRIRAGSFHSALARYGQPGSVLFVSKRTPRKSPGRTRHDLGV